MTHAHMSLFDAIYSQRAIRHFSEQPVSDEAVESLLARARRALRTTLEKDWKSLLHSES